MKDTLLYIATHLDYYHFNTDNARLLKRELQQWTTLPQEEQAKVAQERGLLQRFQCMFANNPFLERNALVIDSEGDDAVPREITGAAAEGYFDSQGNCLTLHPKGSQQGDGVAEYLLDEKIAGLTEAMCQEAEQAQAQFAERRKAIMENKKAQFAHILRKTSTISGKKVKNPTLFSIIICILFYIVAARYILLDCRLISAIQIYGKEIFSVSGDYRNMLIVAAVVLLVALFRLPLHVNMIVKGFYRASIVHRFKKAEARQKKTEKRVCNAFKPKEWFAQYAEALRQDRNLIESTPDVPPARLQTTAMLWEKPDLILFDDHIFPERPWKRFKACGEKRKIRLSIVLIIVMLVMNRVLPIASIIS